MNKILINIVLTVTLSLFGFGWLIDKYAEQSPHHLVQSEQLRTQLLNGLVNILSDTSPQYIEQELNTLKNHFDIDIALENIDDYALGNDLIPDLQSGGLILESEQSTFTLRVIPNHPNLLLKLSEPRQPKDDTAADLLLTLLLYLGVSFAVVLWVLPLIKSLSSLTKVAKDFGSGNLQARVNTKQYSQIKLLENSFNKMASQIEQLIDENRVLANSLSHDLRTPLACFRFGLHASLKESDVNKKNHYIQKMESDLENMEQMLNAFLHYASMERLSFELDYSKHDIVSFVNSIVNDIRPLANKDSKMISCVNELDSALIEFDVVWMYSAFSNLLSNAIQYANSQVTVILTIEKQQKSSGNNFVCYICDDGSGIPEEQLKDVFNPFVRLDTSRKRDKNNFGLGLAIVKRVFTWHDFEVSFLDDSTLNEKMAMLTKLTPAKTLSGAIAKVSISLPN